MSELVRAVMSTCIAANMVLTKVKVSSVAAEPV